MAVLTLLIAVVAGMVNSTSKVTGLSNTRLSIDSEARAIFERMARDFNGMIRRSDVDCTVYPYSQRPDPLFKSTGNDYLGFFSEATAVKVGDAEQSGIEDTVGMVSYRIWAGPAAETGSLSPPYSLDRYDRGTALRVPLKRGLLFLTAKPTAITAGNSYLAVNPQIPNDIINAANNVDPATTIRANGGGQGLPDPATENTASDQNFHCVGEQTYRLEFALLLKYPNPANPLVKGPYYRDTTTTPAANSADQQLTDLRDVAAIVATIALVPSDVRVKLGTTAYNTEIAKAVAALTDGNNPSIATDWENTLRTSTSDKIHPLITQNTRVYQRFFYLK